MEKLNFEEFKKAIVDGVKGFLPENFDLGEIKLSVVTKNNNMKLTGLTIMRRGQRHSADHLSGGVLPEVLRE